MTDYLKIVFALTVALGSFGVGFGCGRWATLRRQSAQSTPVLVSPWHKLAGHAHKVWFPQGGRWILGYLGDPTDPSEQYFWVDRLPDFKRFRVAMCDLRLANYPLRDPAPGLSVVELEDEMGAKS